MSADQPKLKACPFCGSAPKIRGGVNSYGHCATIGCHANRAQVVTFDVAEQVAAWNRRAIPSSDEVRLAGASLLAQVDHIAKAQGWPDNAPRENLRRALISAPTITETLRAALAEARYWHELRADLAFDEARECSERGEKPQENAAMHFDRQHRARIDAIDEALRGTIKPDEDWIRGLISEAFCMASDEEQPDESSEEVCRISDAVLEAIRPYLRPGPKPKDPMALDLLLERISDIIADADIGQPAGSGAGYSVDFDTDAMKEALSSYMVSTVICGWRWRSGLGGWKVGRSLPSEATAEWDPRPLGEIQIQRGGYAEETAARERIAAFMREWSKGSHNGTSIYGLNMGVEGREAELTVSDLLILLNGQRPGPERTFNQSLSIERAKIYLKDQSQPFHPDDAKALLELAGVVL